jgi:hypothetical protein
MDQSSRAHLWRKGSAHEHVQISAHPSIVDPPKEKLRQANPAPPYKEKESQARRATNAVDPDQIATDIAARLKPARARKAAKKEEKGIDIKQSPSTRMLINQRAFQARTRNGCDATSC